MSKVSFVIGAMASGKTHFIEHFLLNLIPFMRCQKMASN